MADGKKLLTIATFSASHRSFCFGGLTLDLDRGALRSADMDMKFSAAGLYDLNASSSFRDTLQPIAYITAMLSLLRWRDRQISTRLEVLC